MIDAMGAKNSIDTILYAIESQQSLCPLQKIMISHMLLYQPTQGYRYIFLVTGGPPFVQSFLKSSNTLLSWTSKFSKSGHL